MKPNVIGAGELLWDMLASGPRMGGAPANFTCHTKALGAEASVVSRVGDDDGGTLLLKNLEALGVNSCGITRDEAHPTGTVEVTLGDDGQPHFEITRGVAWDHLELSPSVLKLAAAADAICFGSLCQRSEISRGAIRELVQATPATALRIFDVNLRGDFFSTEIIDESLKLANVCKLSDSELPALAGMLGLYGYLDERLCQLADRYDLDLVVYTRGGNGAILHSRGGTHEQPGIATQVRDTIGAGDSFTAATTMGLLQGWSLEKIAQTANEVAAFVCSKDGAVPPLPRELRERFDWSHWRCALNGKSVIGTSAA